MGCFLQREADCLARGQLFLLIRESTCRIQICRGLASKLWRYLSPERWLNEFETLEIRDDVRPLVLLENAKGVLGID